nr:relaxase/mobilization nuclease domain-containing protein [uncultured Draconibacterium sp.]
MIAKAKAIAHGSRAIEYALRESKKGSLVASNLVQNETPGAIYNEFLELQECNTRCKNKFIRIEIGIAPGDEKKLGEEDLAAICREFSSRFGFENHQWIGCIHRDTEHLHMHMIVNRIGIDQRVYDTSFISKRAGKIAESISRELGLTIANQVKRKSKYRPEVMGFERILAKTLISKAAGEVLSGHPTSLKEFTAMMKKHDIAVQEAVNKKGNTYGLRFTGHNQTFKASQIGKEFGYRTLMNTFKENSQILSQDSGYKNNRKQSQGTSVRNAIFSGIAYISGPRQLLRENDSGISEEERKRKQNLKKKRRYGPKF